MADTEREAFEAWHRRKFATRYSTGQPTRDMHNGIYAEQYGPVHEQQMWEAWQASALASRPADVDDKPCDLCKGTGETQMRAAGAVWRHTCARCNGKGLAPSHTTNKEK